VVGFPYFQKHKQSVTLTNKTEKATEKVQEVTGIGASEAKGKASEVAGKASGKASELSGEAKGTAAEMAGRAKAMKEETKAEAKRP
jgi:hypothetical protein